MSHAMQGAQPGNLIVTNAPADRVRHIAHEAARFQGFGVAPAGEWSFELSQGSLFVSILLGAFIAYCKFQLHITSAPDGNTVVTLIRNKPWWTGVIGVKRVKKKADGLGAGIVSGLQQGQFSVLRHDQS